MIGEIATGYGQPTDQELKALRAAALAQIETGAPIYTHTTYGTLALEQLDVLIDAGAVADRVIVGHADVLHPPADVFAVLKRGALIGVDTVGKENWRALDGTVRHTPDSARIALLSSVVRAGYEHQVVLSSDILFERGEIDLNPDTFGAYGYSYVTEGFLPRLAQSGVSESAIQSMAGLNARRLDP
jgi:phosphotriesterase-related protein